MPLPPRCEDKVLVPLRRGLLRLLDTLPAWALACEPVRAGVAWLQQQLRRGELRHGDLRLARGQQQSEAQRRERQYRHAIGFIRYSQEHRNILTICALRRRERRRTLEAYLLQSSSLYQLVLQGVYIAHALLFFAEPTLTAQLRFMDAGGDCHEDGSLVPWCHTSQAASNLRARPHYHPSRYYCTHTPCSPTAHSPPHPLHLPSKGTWRSSCCASS